MISVTSVLVGCLIGIIFYLYIWAKNFYSYWKVKQVPHLKPILFLGNSKPFKTPPSQLYEEIYERFSNEKIVGLYELTKRRLMIKDPELVNQILIKDFQNFRNRGLIPHDYIHPWERGLFVLDGDLWRIMRNKLSPTFSSGKLKMMFDYMGQAYENMKKEITGEEVDIRRLMFGYTSDIMASCAFGIDITKDKKMSSKFNEMGKRAFKMSLPRMLSLIILGNLPRLAKFLDIAFLPKDVRKFFADIVRQVIVHRKCSNETRNDFLQLLLQLQDKGFVEMKTSEPEDQYLNMSGSSETETIEIDEDLILSQALTFITAGMEPSSNTLLFTCLELARNVQIQNKARQEIVNTIKKNKGFNYEAVREMVYLELCILESLRMYPQAKQLLRRCTKTCDLGGVTVEPGTYVIIPVRSMHMDPRYFSHPLNFDPDRFDTPSHTPGSFQPFGDGPRICIGMKFAMVEMKVCLARLLLEFRLELAPSTQYPPLLNPWSFFASPLSTISLKLYEINQSMYNF